MPTDPEITLRLPQSVLAVVLNHLYAGRYQDVADTVQLIVTQAAPQYTHLVKVAEAEAAPLPSARTQ